MRPAIAVFLALLATGLWAPPASAVGGVIAGLRESVNALKGVTDALKKGMDIIRGDMDALRKEIETAAGLAELGRAYDEARALDREAERLSSEIFNGSILPDLASIMPDLPLCGNEDITLGDLMWTRNDIRRRLDRGEIGVEEASAVLDSIDHALGQAAACTADEAVRPENRDILEDAFLDREARVLGIDPRENCDLCLQARRRAQQRTAALYYAQSARKHAENAAKELEQLTVKAEMPALQAIARRQLELNLQQADALSADQVAADLIATQTDRALRDRQMETVERAQGMLIFPDDETEATVEMRFVMPGEIDEGGN